MSLIIKPFAKLTKSISSTFQVSLVACYLVAGVLIVYFTNSQMKKQALHDASDRARLILYRSLSEHEYFANHLKPELLNDISHLHGKDYFDPTWMSSTYAVREMDKDLRKRIKEEYYYKEAAVNARNKENEADPYEAGFLWKLNHGKKGNEVQAIREINGEKFFTFMIKGETVGPACLRCHGSPAEAPKELVKLYGDQIGFNKKVGEITSAISIRIPLDDAYAAANSVSASLSLILLIVLFAILSVCYIIYRQVIQVPVMTIRNKAIAIVNSTGHLGEQIPVYHENELGELTKAFNWLSVNMKQLLDGLETKVKERTEKYEKANLELKIREEEVSSSLKEKETLLKEIHHRVKNNLQIISSLLNLQMQFVEDEDLKLLFNDSCSRVRSMSLIHEKLYQTESLSKINMKDYVLDLSMFLKAAYVKASQEIEIAASLDEVHLPVDIAVPCGLIINELVSNSLKYAFRGLSCGTIGITLKKYEKKIEISISDNGLGLPDNVDLKNPSTLGLQLVSGLVEQIHGTIEIIRKDGTTFCLRFSAEA
ncbi:MAG TPA: DUF3365 domain-containing protein [Ignavibacteriales bacterium]|nr:DUF3365 domain-containing protein [Ignavibacteriales bacterium]